MSPSIYLKKYGKNQISLETLQKKIDSLETLMGSYLQNLAEQLGNYYFYEFQINKEKDLKRQYLAFYKQQHGVKFGMTDKEIDGRSEPTTQ